MCCTRYPSWGQCRRIAAWPAAAGHGQRLSKSRFCLLRFIRSGILSREIDDQASPPSRLSRSGTTRCRPVLLNLRSRAAAKPRAEGRARARGAAWNADADWPPFAGRDTGSPAATRPPPAPWEGPLVSEPPNLHRLLGRPRSRTVVRLERDPPRRGRRDRSRAGAAAGAPPSRGTARRARPDLPGCCCPSCSGSPRHAHPRHRPHAQRRADRGHPAGRQGGGSGGAPVCEGGSASNSAAAGRVRRSRRAPPP